MATETIIVDGRDAGKERSLQLVRGRLQIRGTSGNGCGNGRGHTQAAEGEQKLMMYVRHRHPMRRVVIVLRSHDRPQASRQHKRAGAALGQRRPVECRETMSVKHRPRRPSAAGGPLAIHRQPADHNGSEDPQPGDQRPINRRISRTKSGHCDGCGAFNSQHR